MKASSISFSDISFGWPSCSATMLMPNTVSIGVCAYRLLSTISVISPRLQLDDDAHAVLVGLVAQLRDALDVLVAHQLGDALDQARLVDLVGQLGDDDRLAVALADLLEMRARADRQPPAAGAIGGRDLLRAVDDAGGRESPAPARAASVRRAAAPDHRAAPGTR